MRLGAFTKVYPSLRYTLADDTSAADDRRRRGRARRSAPTAGGMKIAVVDDGIDQTNPFFDPRGYAYPPGFPKGDTR